MKDYIKELCNEKGIKLVYTKNKLTILSGGSQNGVPTLRVHDIFENCSRKTAQALVNYYLDIEKRENYHIQIQNHARKHLGSRDFKISPLGDHFITAFTTNGNGEKVKPDPDFGLMEHTITSIIQKNFNGSNSKIITDGIIEVQEDGIAELDILVGP